MAGMLGALSAGVATQSVAMMIVAGIVTAALPFLYVWFKRKKRLEMFLELLPDALDLVSRALSAGHAFSEALHMVAAEMPEPIAESSKRLTKSRTWVCHSSWHWKI